MTKQMRATIQQASRQYVQDQRQYLGGRVKKQDLSNAATKVSKILERMEAAKLRLRK